jgi:hypothetical protein
MRQNEGVLRRVLLTARAIATGFLVTLLFRAVVAVPFAAANRRWGSAHWLSRWLFTSVLTVMLPTVAAVLAGWVVARLHRQHQAAMVVSYALFVVAMSMPRFYSVVSNALNDVRFFPYVLNHALNVAVVTGGVLVGGLWLAREPAEKQPGLTQL